MNSFVLYIKESYNELMHNVTWPSMEELMSNAGLVLVATVIFALIVFFFDFLSKTGLGFIGVA